VISRVFLPDSVVAEQCGIHGPMIDEMKSILGTTRVALAREREAGKAAALEEAVGRCGSTNARAGDAGASR
jgi:hypothetical protein